MSQVKAQLDAAVKAMTAKPHAADLESARKEYFGVTGEVYEDDPSFEVRMILFLEWYVLDRPLARGVVPIRAYLEENAESLGPGEREAVDALLRHRHGIFKIKKTKPPFLSLKDFWDGKTLKVEDIDVARSFQAGDIVDARIVNFEGKNWFAEGILCHPRASEGFIKAELKALRIEGGTGPGEFTLRLAGMLRKYERYRGIKPENIYRNA
ncbi:MAG: hypothetical protein Q8R92_03430 [Deltaproteobacteria bacterium]|nr:hypothetical protein [Deltaproteobacteria bacterium]